ncbi:MAG: tRNA (guanosine(37)-N1)-methyltransferase TrmD [candidate division NC10 bacterium]|nr:tRNA (guanosine(37)-N1)-methyltransferase TrmD [candidate division NC10 bacterium]
MKRYEVLTIFPGIFHGPLQESILKRAQEKGIVRIVVHDLRNWTHDRHRTVDDRPYGGGAGMVLKVEPVVEAVEALRGPKTRFLLLSPQGRRFGHEVAKELSLEEHLLFLCGRYEGFDERVRLILKPDEISIGDYVLTGGEVPALVVMDAVIRLIPGVLGDEESARENSFAQHLLDHPDYTRPASFRGFDVPPVLLSGDHERIRRWRRKEALRRTKGLRPDLLSKAFSSQEDLELLAELDAEAG